MISNEVMSDEMNEKSITGNIKNVRSRENNILTCDGTDVTPKTGHVTTKVLILIITKTNDIISVSLKLNKFNHYPLT